MGDPVRVTVYDPMTGDTESRELQPDSYILLLGENKEVTSLSRYANGTVQFTIKDKSE